MVREGLAWRISRGADPEPSPSPFRQGRRACAAPAYVPGKRPQLPRGLAARLSACRPLALGTPSAVGPPAVSLALMTRARQLSRRISRNRPSCIDFRRTRSHTHPCHVL
jgi:hypothetical protein